MDKNFEERKEFALSQLAPYVKNPSTCGYDKESNKCEYLAKNGNMCVAGKNMIKPSFGLDESIDGLLENNGFRQEGLFKPEVVGILTTQEWTFMQFIHDTIAKEPTNVDRLKDKIQDLNLFTYEELVERANSLE